MRLGAVVACFLLAGAPVVSGQRKWVGPQSPCDIKPGFFRLNSAVVDLQKAVEQPRLRDRMLGQAQDVLIRSIRDDNQDQNPAAWYYLGRYYIEVEDGIGADSAFDRAVALMPDCKSDIDRYRTQLANSVLSRGLTAWHAGQRDSAAVLLRQAYAIDPSQPGPLFQLGAVYLEGGQNDSAVSVLRAAVQASAGDTSYASARRDALLTVARLAFTSAQSDPAVQKWQHTRYSRDSLQLHLTADSTVLARMQESSASRRARRARLSPADQETFSRDSTARAEAVARGQASRETLAQQALADSGAVQAAYEAASAAYRDVVAAFPADVDAATTLAAIYTQSGRREDARAVFDGLFAHSNDLSATRLHDLGRRLVQAKMMEAGMRAYGLLLQRNPYDRNVLAELISVSVDVRDTTNVLALARRLHTLDPLNQSALRLVGQAWGLGGQRDSAATYAAHAEALPVDITIASMVTDSEGVTLTGVASNLKRTPSKAFRIVVEFLDAKGTALESQTVEIGTLAPDGNRQFEVKAGGQAIAGWRYHVP
jgi:tetratricopeptide (TPR) repeat protein